MNEQQQTMILDSVQKMYDAWTKLDAYSLEIIPGDPVNSFLVITFAEIHKLGKEVLGKNEKSATPVKPGPGMSEQQQIETKEVLKKLYTALLECDRYASEDIISNDDPMETFVNLSIDTIRDLGGKLFDEKKADEGEKESTTTKRSLIDKLKDVYFSKDLYDHERRNRTYNLLIVEWGKDLPAPRDTEPDTQRLNAETGECAPHTPAFIQKHLKNTVPPQKTIIKKTLKLEFDAKAIGKKLKKRRQKKQLIKIFLQEFFQS
jgi:hypothetical protein